MSSGRDKIEKGVNTIVAEAGITLDTGLLCKNIIILSFKIADNLAKALNLSAPVHPHIPY